VSRHVCWFVNVCEHVCSRVCEHMLGLNISQTVGDRDSVTMEVIGNGMAN